MKSVRCVLFGSMLMLVTMTSHAWAEGMPDILGIALGMPAREAYAKLQAELPKYKAQVRSVNLPTIEKPVIASFWSGPQESLGIGMEGDQVMVYVTLPPNKQTVWKVDRTHFFPNKGIPKATLLASLREKYGKETIVDVNQGRPATNDSEIKTLLWLLDEQGRPVAPPSGLKDINGNPMNVRHLLAQCSGGGAETLVEVGQNFPNMDPAFKWCFSSYTAVEASFSTSITPELYNQMHLVIVSAPLGARAGDITKKWKDDIAEGAHKRDLEKAAQQEKPKL